MKTRANYFKRLTHIALSVAMVIWSVAPGLSGFVPTAHADPDPPVLTTITVSAPTSMTVGGATQTLTASGLDQYGASITTTPTWTSSDTSVATVDASGVVTAVGAGSAFITATDGSVHGDSATFTVALAAPVLTTITVSAPTSMTVGGPTQTLTASGFDQYGASITTTPTWTSSDTSVATVDASGVVTAVGAGSAFITATDGSVHGDSATFTVSSAVTPPPTTGTYAIPTEAPAYLVNPSATGVDALEAFVKTSGVSFANPGLNNLDSGWTATTVNPTFAAEYGPLSSNLSENLNIAVGAQDVAVDIYAFTGCTTLPTTACSSANLTDAYQVTFSNGFYTGYTALSGDPITDLAAENALAPAVLTTITVSAPTSMTVGGATQTLTASGLDQYGASITTTPTWTSSDTSVATVDASGVVTAVGAGSAFITATDGSVHGDSATFTVALAAPVLTTITVSAPTSMTVGGPTQTLTASGFDQYGASITTTPTWTSSDTSVATVDASGVVTAVGAGSAFITATDGSVHGDSATFTVSSAVTPPPTTGTYAIPTEAPAYLVNPSATGVDALEAFVKTSGVSFANPGLNNLDSGWTATTVNPTFAAEYGPLSSNLSENLNIAVGAQDVAVDIYAFTGCTTLPTTACSSANLTDAYQVTFSNGFYTGYTALSGDPITDLAAENALAPAVLTTITVSAPTSMTVGGATQTLTASGLDQYGASITTTPTWTSSDTSVATVDASGVVTAVGAGSAFITATDGSVHGDSATFTVASAPTLTFDTGITFGGSSVATTIANPVTITTDGTAVQFTLDVTGTVATPDLVANDYGFTLDADAGQQAALQTYFTGKVGSSGSMYDQINSEITGGYPFFYLSATGTGAAQTYSLVDGFQKGLGAGDKPLVLDNDYPVGTYVYKGTLIGSNTATLPVTVTLVVARQAYTLTYTAGDNGSITGTSPQTVNSGDSGSAVTAVPADGYHFVSWSDESTANPRTDSDVTADVNVTASFAINTYTLTYTAGDNGSITGTSPQTVNSGDSGSAVTAVPADGYHFVSWSDESTANPRTDSDVTADVNVTASFAINTYTLTYTAGDNGSITGTSPQTVNSGDSGSAVTAVPADGYHFVSWSDESTANPRTDSDVTADVNVTASFAINTYTLTYTAGDNGSITGTSPQTVNSGDSGSAVTAVPADGYHFVSWSDESTANPRTDSDVTADVNVTASFAINTYTLTYTAGDNGSITGTSPQTVNSGDSGSAVTAVPADGYHFVSWSDESTANPRTDSDVTADVNVTASFAINTYTLTYTAGDNGSITGTSPQTVNSGDSGSAVTAVPADGYHFVSWSDESTANPRTDSDVTADVNVTASFAINTYTLTYTAGDNGSITGTSPQTVNSGDSGSAVTAVPADGYHFVSWSDESTANPRTDSDVTADVNVTASFAINTYTLTYTAGDNGSITGTSPQTVNSGDSGSAVTAVPADGYHFVSWSDESTANPRTDSDVTADVNVTASFEINPLTVSSAASISDINVANGTVLGSAGLPTTAIVTLSDESTTTLAVTWTSGTPAYDGNTASTYPFIGTLTLPDGATYTNPNNVTASVNVIVAAPVTVSYGGGGGGGTTYYNLNVTKTGTGSGSITANGSTCNGSCSFSYGTTVTLTATPASGSSFSVWSGACSGSASTCSVVLNGNQTVGASFILGQVLGESAINSHPNGTLILDGQTIYLIQNQKRYGFRNEAEYLSYGYKFSQAVVINDADRLLPTGDILKAMTGTVVLDGSDNRTVYLIGANSVKRGFTSAEVFTALGYSFAGLPVINLADYPVGDPIASSTAAHPEGALVLDSAGTVWWILDGQRDGFESLTVFNTYGFTFDRVVPANSADMALPVGPLVKLRDGTLVSQGGVTYIISDGQKLQFASAQALTSRGYNAANVVPDDVSGYTAGATLP